MIDFEAVPPPPSPSEGFSGRDKMYLVSILANGLIWAALQMEKHEPTLAACAAKLKDDPHANYRYARMVAEALTADLSKNRSEATE